MPAPQLSRQQRRKIRRDAIERGQKVLARGLGEELAEDAAVGVALILHACLRDAARASPASDAAEIVETLLEKSVVADLKGLDLGCRKGCVFCCSALVTCSAPEIFRVARWLSANAGADLPTKVGDVAAEAGRRRDFDLEHLFAQKPPCPMLVSGACGVYAARPIPCRALYSTSAEACRLALHEDQGEVPLVIAAMNKGEMVRTLLLAAMSAAGLPDRGIELTGGVTAAIATPDAEARWLAGEDVFADVLGSARLPSAREGQNRIANIVRNLID